MNLADALHQHFGFAAFRPGQEEALNLLLAGHDVLTVMPTGSGKSLIYQLAALQLPGTTLVISPLVALMKDQVDGLVRRQIAATFINSSLSLAEQDDRLHAMAAGEYKIVLVAPERLRSATFRRALSRVALSLLAVDEAHCLSQWGHDFRPDYLHLVDLRREFHPPLTLALTATATTRVQDDIIQLLGLSRVERLVTGFNRPNLTLEVLSTTDVQAKLGLVREFLLAAEGAGIIYTGTRRDAEEVADFVRETVNLPVAYYHAGLEPDTRTAIQESFLAGDLPVIVATNAFGMGIDRPDVRFVLHYSLPGTLEAYYQEAGRAGRDGLPAQAALLYSTKDTALQEFFIETAAPSAVELRAVHHFAQATPRTTFEALERATGLDHIKARVAVEQLEAASIFRRAPAEPFGELQVEVAPLAEATLNRIVQQVVARQRHKRALLGRMVAYAETNACRRRIILDYFGDRGKADAPLCCDNCLARAEATSAPVSAAATEAEHAALVVLETVQALKWGLGRSKIAKLLKGSNAEDVEPYRKHPNFGKLIAMARSEIESLVEQLIDAGYLKHVGSEQPVLKLTPRGEAALQTRSAIQVKVHPVRPGVVERQQAAREAGGTVALTGQMLAQGLSPEQIAERRALTVGTVYSHLARLIAEGTVDVDKVVPAELQKQIRAAIAQAGSANALAPIKMRLPVEIDYNIIRCVVEAYKRERGDTAPVNQATARMHAPAQAKSERGDTIKPAQQGPTLSTLSPALPPSSQPTSDPVADFMAHPHPRPLKGPWRAGWALDFHSRFDGEAQSRGIVGALVFRYKYHGERGLAGELAARWAQLLAEHPELPRADAVIPVPPSLAREFDPVTELARALASALSIPALLGVLVKTRATQPQKEMTSLAQKRANVAGAFALKGTVRGKRLILVDDLYDSGATLEEASRVLTRGGAIGLVVLTLTKTIHTTD